MLPILLIVKNQKLADAYLKDFINYRNIAVFNIFRYKPLKDIITIDQIRDIQPLLTRIEKEKKLIIIYSFDTAKTEAQNAFLKTLEEKSPKAYFILIADSQLKILPTVVSRCQICRLKEKQIIKTSVKENFLNDLNYAKLLSSYTVLEKENALGLCDQFISYFRIKIKTVSKNEIKLILPIILLLKEIIKVKNLIIKNNLNAQAGIDHLLLLASKIPVC